MKRIKHLLLIVALLLTGSVFSKAQAQTYTWNNVVIMGGGFVPGLVYSPVQQGLLYARTDVGGFYRWNNSTGQWIPLVDMYGPGQANNFGGESIAPDPVNANVVYAAAGSSGLGAILSSTNQGNSWTVNSLPVSMAGNNDGREAGERLAVDPNLTSKLYFGSRWQGLWVSTNSAASWSQVTAFPVLGDTGYGLSWIIFDPHGTSGSASTTIYAGVLAMASGNSNIYRSTNAGSSWSLVSGGPSNMVTPHASLGTDGNLWIVYDSGGYGPNGITTGQIWKLNTATLAWTNTTPSNGPGSGSGGYGGISVDPENASHVLVTTLDWWSGPDKVLSTANAGGSWTVIGLPGSGGSTFNDNGAVWSLGCNNSTQGGTGWAGCVAIDPFNSNNAIYPSSGAAPGGGVWSSTNIQANPVAWTFTDLGIEETVPIFMPPSAEGGVLFSCMGDVGGMRHTNLTQSPASGMYCNPQFSNTNMLDFAEANPNTVVRVGNSNISTSNDVAYSTNNGQSWTPWGSAPPGYTTDNQMGSVAVAANGSRVVVSPYSGYGSPAYASSLGGGWTSCSGLPSGACVAADRSSPLTFYATYPAQWVYGGTVTVYESTNGGAAFSQVNTIPVNWSDANGNGQFVVPRPVFGEPGEFWVSTYSNLYRFTNGGSSVTAFSNVYEPMGPVGFGKAASGQTHPAVFLIGTVNGTYGFFRSDDGAGVTWTQIMDTNHQYGKPSWMEGDETIYGRVYIGAGGRGIIYGDTSAVTPTSTPTASPTKTATPTATRTSTVTLTPTLTATATPSVTLTKTQTLTPTPSLTLTTTRAPTSTVSATSTATITATRTATSTLSPTQTLSPSPTASVTKTFTATMSPTLTLTSTPSMTKTMTPTLTATLTGTLTTSPTVTPTVTLTFTLVPGATNTFTPTITSTPTLTMSPSATATSSPTSTFSTTPTVTLAATNTKTPTSTVTKTWTATSTATATLTPTFSSTRTLTPTNTVTPAATLTPTPQATLTLSLSAAPSSVVPDDFMTYTIQLVISNGPSNSTVLVLNLPTGVTVSGYTTGPSGSISGSQVFWNLGTLTPGTYTFGVEVTVLSGASGTLSAQAGVSAPAGEILSNSAAVTVTPWTATPTATAAVTPVSNPVIYPNPVNGPGPILIRLPNYPGLADISVKVYTTAFRLVDKFTALQEAGGSDVSLPLTDQGGTPLANGLYYVVVTTPLGKSIEKLLIIR